jgi:hypothetical protein
MPTRESKESTSDPNAVVLISLTVPGREASFLL